MRPTVVIVTGMSGAGKTTALHTLEDLGYFCVDNLPTALAPQAVHACEGGGMRRVALGIDVRVGSFLASVSAVVGELEADGAREVHVLFFDASDEALLNRFSESRRPHPMASQQIAGESTAAVAVLDGIRLERERLASLRARSTRVYDTTHLSVHELRRALLAQFGPGGDGLPQMTTRVLSFGFKYGLPSDADLVFDVRFLENPYFVPHLKLLPGTDERVRDFVLGLAEAREFLDKTSSLIDFVLPRYRREGKSYLTVAIGCTGGRHRSVVLAEALGARLGAPNDGFSVVHRDVARGDRVRAREESIHNELKGAANSPPATFDTPAPGPTQGPTGERR